MLSSAIFVLLFSSLCLGEDCGTHLEGEKYEVSECSSYYYQCVHENREKFPCPTSTVFHPTSKNCGYRHKLPACSSVKIVDCKDPNGDPVDGFIYTKSADCNKGIFYACDKSTEMQKSCGSGLIFDPSTGNCNWEANIEDCTSTSIDSEKLTTTTATTTATTKTTTTTPKSEGCGKHAEGERYAVGDCSSYYYQCVHGVQQKKECPPGTVFDPITQTFPLRSQLLACSSVEISDCMDENGDPVDGFSYTKSTDCNDGTYYVCKKGVEVKKSCAPGLIFDPSIQICNWKMSVEDCKSTSIDSDDTITEPPPPADTTTTTSAITSTKKSDSGSETTPDDEKDPTPMTTTTTTKTTKEPDGGSETTAEDKKDPTPTTTTPTTKTTKMPEGGSETTEDDKKDPTPTTTTPNTKTTINPEDGATTVPPPLADNTTTTGTTTSTKTTKKPDSGSETTEDDKKDPTPTTTTPTTKTTKKPEGGSETTADDKKDPTPTTTTPNTKTTINPEDPDISPSNTTTIKTTVSTTITTTPEPERKTYVGFVVDDTGSMSTEISAVRQWISDCVSGVNADCGEEPTGGWIITSFNDPYVGRVVGPTTNSKTILDEASTYFAWGGGDCPEMAFTGLENVANVVPDGSGVCKVYFFTDATATDESKSASVTQLYKNKNCALVPILTGCCGTCPDACDSVSPEYCEDHVTDSRTSESSRVARSTGDDSRTLFYIMSEETGGNIYVTDKPSSPDDFLDFLEDKVTLGFCSSTELAGPPGIGYKCEADCVAKNQCWDRSVSKCYCNTTCEHEEIPKGSSACGGGQVVICDPEVIDEFILSDDCKGFFRCYSGRKAYFNCANGTVASSSSPSHCDHPRNVPPPCGTKNKDEKSLP